MGKYALLRKDRVPYPKPLSALHEENTPYDSWNKRLCKR